MTDNPSTKLRINPSTGLPTGQAGSGLSKNKLQKAFSLIEIIVVVAITSVILIVTMQILSSAIRIESRTLVAQAMYEQVNYLIDYMSKDIRMAARGPVASDDACGRLQYEKFTIVDGKMSMKDQRNNCVRYYLAPDNINDTSQIFTDRRDWDNNAKDWGNWYGLPLTSSDYKILDFQTQVIKSDSELTKVMIGLTIQSKTYKDVVLQIQTLVSTRNRD